MAFDAYESWLNITAADRPPTYYDLLGLAPFESDPEIIEQAALRRMGKVRQHQIGPHSDLSQEILAELALARLVLSDPDRRGDYDAKLKARGVEPFADLRPAVAGTVSKSPGLGRERFRRLRRLTLAAFMGIPFLVRSGSLSSNGSTRGPPRFDRPHRRRSPSPNHPTYFRSVTLR